MGTCIAHRAIGRQQNERNPGRQGKNCTRVIFFEPREFRMGEQMPRVILLAPDDGVGTLITRTVEHKGGRWQGSLTPPIATPDPVVRQR